MKRLALVTSILLGATAIAPAWADSPQGQYDQHDQHWNDRGYQGRRVDRRDRDLDHDRYRNPEQWRSLAVALPVAPGRQVINLAGDQLRRLRIEAVRGTPLITRVIVVGANGQQQVLQPNQRLDVRTNRTAFNLDLPMFPGGVRRVVVFSQVNRWAQYSVLADTY